MGGGASKKKCNETCGPLPARKPDVDMILLGAPSVGKSTIFRQMKLLFRNGLTTKERTRLTFELRQNLLLSILKLDEIGLTMGFFIEDEEVEEAITRLKMAVTDYDYDERDDENAVENQGLQNESVVDPNAERLQELEFPSEDVMQVFKDPTIQKVYQHVISGTFELDQSDSAGREIVQEALPYVLRNIERIIDPEMIPSDDDCLHLRRMTTGVEKITYSVTLKNTGKYSSSLLCMCTDIGGQAQEQTKWEVHSKTADLIVFVASLADFDRILPDGSNSFTMQLQLLNQVICAPCFYHCNVIVLLNKQDILIEKLKTKNLADYIEDFGGSTKVEDAVMYVQEKCQIMLEQDAEKCTNGSRQVQTVTTCALDSNMVENVLIGALSAATCSAISSFGLFG